MSPSAPRSSLALDAPRGPAYRAPIAVAVRAPAAPRPIMTMRPALLSLAALLALGGCASVPTASPAWRLVWSDEFDGPAGQPPDSASWRYDVGTDWGNQQLEYDTDRATNAALDGAGNLVITARRESFEGQQYTSARINTQGRHEFRYGRFEARMRMPTGQGLWPAFWLLGADAPTVGWPDCGEIDVMEYRGQEPSTVIGTVHGPGYSGAAGVTRRYTVPRARLDADFHVYAVEWTTDRVDWFVDDTRYFSVRRSDVPGRWVFDHPFFVILDLAVGGGFVGAPDATTVFPQTLAVDWVRVYERAP